MGGQRRGPPRPLTAPAPSCPTAVFCLRPRQFGDACGAEASVPIEMGKSPRDTLDPGFLDELIGRVGLSERMETMPIEGAQLSMASAALSDSAVPRDRVRGLARQSERGNFPGPVIPVSGPVRCRSNHKNRTYSGHEFRKLFVFLLWKKRMSGRACAIGESTSEAPPRTDETWVLHQE